MSGAPAEHGFISRSDYHRWRAAQPAGRYERVEGCVVAMAPERGAHLRAKAAIWLALRQAIAATHADCQALPDGATVESGENDFEPDATVNCGPPMADDAICAPNPVIVVEVLSPGTPATDTGGKLVGYFSVPSIAHYLIADPRRRVVIHHQKAGEGITTRIIAAGKIDLSPPGITITAEECFAG